MNVESFLSRMPAREFREWMRWHQYNSIGMERVELLLASLLCHVHNYMAGKHGRKLRIQDVLPQKPRDHYPPVEVVWGKVMAWFSTLNAYYGAKG